MSRPFKLPAFLRDGDAAFRWAEKHIDIEMEKP